MRRLLFFLACFLVSMGAFCQTYYPFATENKIWAELQCDMGGCYTRYYKFGGDTILGGKTYKKVYSCSDSLMLNWYNTNIFIREDSLQKVYAKNWNDEEVMIYDFQLEVGDSIDSRGTLGGQPIFAHVDSVDSVLVKNEYRKRIIFESWFNESWIEGIGSSNVVFNPFLNSFIADLQYYLLCVIDEDTVIYHDVSYTSCYVFWGAIQETVIGLQERINIFPNPTSTSFSIQLPPTFGTLEKLEIFNSVGQVVGRYKTVENVDISGFPCGLYFVVVTGEGGEKVTGRVVKE